MKLTVVIALLALNTLTAHAQLVAPATPPRAVQDANMIVMDRGSKLEILPTARALPEVSSMAVNRHQIIEARTDAPVSNKQLGVVFNHAMQQTGFFTGEIAFKAKAGVEPLSILEQGLRPKRLGKTDVYFVRATTPRQFKSVLMALQGRPTLEWVEPNIIYGAHDLRDL
jgi:hypothetical protein